jgi:hypothetical protein
MSNAQPKRPRSSSSATPRSEFNWPPTDDEMQQYESKLGEGESRFDESDFNALDLFATEELDTASGVSPEATATAPAANPSAPDRSGAGEWATEIARLQTLIEDLTENIEWR